MAKDIFDEIVEASLDALITPNVTGWIGESATAVELWFSKLLGIKGVTFRNLYLPKDDGTTAEIDLLYATAKGIFVIESKNYSGWIFGDDKSQQWTAMLPNKEKFRFYNPVWQNAGHIKWLERYLQRDIPMFSLIVFSQRCELKKVTVETPHTYVLKRDDLYGVLRALWKKLPSVLAESELKTLCDRLRPLTLVDAATKERHIEQARAVQTQVAATCPHCGGKLVLRTARKGENAGKPFYGCENYPKCRYIRNL